MDTNRGATGREWPETHENGQAGVGAGPLDAVGFSLIFAAAEAGVGAEPLGGLLTDICRRGGNARGEVNPSRTAQLVTAERPPEALAATNF